MHKFLFFILIFICTTGSAQKKGYNKGYIVNLDGDTILGWVKDRSTNTAFLEIYARIRFRAKKPRLKRKYGTDEILGYSYDNQYFESVPLKEETALFKFNYSVDPNNEKVFLKRIVSNHLLTYYEQEFIDDDNSYLYAVPFLYKTNAKQMVRATQGMFGLKRKKLAAYFSDCPKFVERIKNKKLKTTQEIFEFYSNYCN
ncbi:hypothetical protein MTsPCn9_03430 [Croceitalea sp. MTPC9]|uniref:hypothetical protein n=1 Tax=unclassified Croceitalea TaxID=2632280 RepID=UPI002B372783|nr:hypothetical protein MTsPCn6_05280 [Croceitalea sp. MTPC6]GMN15407.1 hypothetical protein MTsPCn9_03430 [Croceitalea sp. MTPC9]